MKHVFTAFIVAIITGLSSVGFACSSESNLEFKTDPTLPAITFQDFDVEVTGIMRGNNEERYDDCYVGGAVGLKIVPVDPEVGYIITLAKGPAPKSLGLFTSPRLPTEYGDGFFVMWRDEESNDQPAVNFTLRVTAIGPNGEEGPSQDVMVSDPGSDDGCSAAGHQDASLLGLFTFGMFFLWRRRE